MPTIGVSIAVPEPWGSELQAFRASVGDTSAEGIPTHITLMPPHEIDDEQLPEIQKHLAAAAAAGSPFRVHLRGTGTFRPVSPVVFVVVVDGIAACEQLAFAIRRGPLATDLKFPYHPHVTVAHGVSDEQLDHAFRTLSSFECAFDVDRFSLYVHAPADGWVPTCDFPLTAGAEGMMTW